MVGAVGGTVKTEEHSFASTDGAGDWQTRSGDEEDRLHRNDAESGHFAEAEGKVDEIWDEIVERHLEDGAKKGIAEFGFMALNISRGLAILSQRLVDTFAIFFKTFDMDFL